MDRWLSRPIPEVIEALAVGVAEGQVALDERSMAIEREYRAAVEAGALPAGLEAPWFRFAAAEADLSVELSLHGREVYDDAGEVRAYRPIIAASPPGSRRSRETTINATSTVRVQIAPVPPGGER
ncbi:hypothetical protein [Halalkalirubrum salinum]|uniref:hypothetical protein n=1 Tax=Halalkalirubrum salinum TaxID=2563889 RepID=UPI0010FAF171|nr:hypothetical protein [Halalkalirubrum salinum]